MRNKIASISALITIISFVICLQGITVNNENTMGISGTICLVSAIVCMIHMPEDDDNEDDFDYTTV